MAFQKRILLLGAGELGKELVISLKRLGQIVCAVDRYPGAPAMQVADEFKVLNMLDPEALALAVKEFSPDIVIPEIEAIRTEKLFDFEAQGLHVVPSARATHLTMNRDAIRDLASRELQLETAKYHYASTFVELKKAANYLGFPVVIKPVMSSSGKGQSVVKSAKDLKAAWNYAMAHKRGDQLRIIVEEFIPFESEITLLTIKQFNGPTIFLDPIGHRQENGDYRESWMPAKVSRRQLRQAQAMAEAVTQALGGAGLFGVEFFLTKDRVYFSELSPRPHDTGMVTLISQNLSEFDLHARAVLGLPIPQVIYNGPAASHVVLSNFDSKPSTKLKMGFDFRGIEDALKIKNIDVRIFGKPLALQRRRMGVVLALGGTVKKARVKAHKAANKIQLVPLA